MPHNTQTKNATVTVTLLTLELYTCYMSTHGAAVWRWVRKEGQEDQLGFWKSRLYVFQHRDEVMH